MRFSLIVPTLNRVKELERLFQSLASQDYPNFEVILVDQNLDDRLQDLIAAYAQQFVILHLKQKQRGLSRARNLGRSHINGEIIAFPDDDSVYPPTVLSQVAHFLERDRDWDGVIARIFDLNTDQNAFEFCGGNDESGTVDYWKGYTVGIAHAMFFRAAVVKAVAFDETLGVGSGTPWGAGEDVDYLFQCIKAKYTIYYNSKLIVRHPSPFNLYSFRQLVWREYSYGRGNGYLLGRNFPSSFVWSKILSICPSVLVTFFKGQFDYSAYITASVIGMSLGYWDSVIRQWKSGQILEKSTVEPSE